MHGTWSLPSGSSGSPSTWHFSKSSSFSSAREWQWRNVYPLSLTKGQGGEVSYQTPHSQFVGTSRMLGLSWAIYTPLTTTFLTPGLPGLAGNAE